MDTGLRHLCQSTQSVGLDDHVATTAPEEALSMLQSSADSKKLAIAQANTQNSRVLHLPAEIRNHMYDLVLSAHRDFHTHEVVRREYFPRRGGRKTATQKLALLQVCRQLYTETHLIALNSTPFAFTSFPNFSKYLAQTLLPRQISAIAVLKCPYREIYFPGFGVNSAFIGLVRDSLRGLKVLVLFGATNAALGDEGTRKMEERIARDIKDECGGLEVKVELTRMGLEHLGKFAAIYSRDGFSLGAE